MPRELSLSNGRLLVNFDHEYYLCDLYWPHVGQENHTAGHPFRFGLFMDGRFSWMAEYIDVDGLPLPSWDLWEERHGVHAWTVGTVWAGLQAAARFAADFGEEDLASRYRGTADRMENAASSVYP